MSMDLELAELHSERQTKVERLTIVRNEQVEAEKLKADFQRRLNGYGATRMWLNERRHLIDDLRLALTREWTEKINQGERDVTPGADAFDALTRESNLLSVVYREVALVAEPAARDGMLNANLGVESAKADAAQLECDIHNLTSLEMAQSLGQHEGSVEIKGARSEQLARTAYQAVQDREAARNALQMERDIQRKRTEESTGPVRYSNPV